MLLKNYVFLFCLIAFCNVSISAQELSIDLFIFGNQKEPRVTQFSTYEIGGQGQLGIAYSDTLKGKFDYKMGLSYSASFEQYYSVIEIEDVGPSGMPLKQYLREGDYYQAQYIALNLGVIYWPVQKRKGFYFPAEVIPLFSINSNREEVRITDENRFQIENFDDDTYNQLNLLLRTGIGYKIIVYKGLSVSFAYNVLLRFGDVVDGVDDSFKLSRGVTLVGGYKF